MDHFVISTSYGNDSAAMLQWAHETGLTKIARVTSVYCDTGWASPEWPQRVELCEAFARSLGIETHRTTSIGMPDLVRERKGFPGTGPTQFCTLHLKGVPFLQWIDEVDPSRAAAVCVGKRRVESARRADTPEFVPASEYHGGRLLWHPLYLHTDAERDALLLRAGFTYPPEGWDGAHDRLYILPSRSKECNPCVYANRGDLLSLSTGEIEKVCSLEVEAGKPMFRPKRFGAVGIYGVVMWAKYGRTGARAEMDVEELFEDEGCGAPMGCGL